MIIDVTNYINPPMSFTESLHLFERTCSDILNEFDYTILQLKYDFLVETGYELDSLQENGVAKRSIGDVIRNAVHNAIRAIIELKDRVVRKIRQTIAEYKRKYEAKKSEAINDKIDKIVNDLESIKDDVEEKCKKGKSDLINLGSDNNNDSFEQVRSKINRITNAIKDAVKKDVDKANVIEAEYRVID